MALEEHIAVIIIVSWTFGLGSGFMSKGLRHVGIAGDNCYVCSPQCVSMV